MTVCMQELRELGLVNVEYPSAARAAVETAVESWKKFCDLPRETKGKFVYLEDTYLDGTGYEVREQSGARKDLKESFHVTLGRYDRLKQLAQEVNDPRLAT